MTQIPSCIFSQYLWCSANIQVDKTSVQFSQFSKKAFIMFPSFLIKMAPLKNGMILREFHLHENAYFQWVQLDSIPEKWILLIKKQ